MKMSFNINEIQVVNVKKKFLNDRCIANFQAWKSQSNTCYIGRDMSLYVSGACGSKWSNPFKVKDHSREKCIEHYEQYIRETPNLWNSLNELLEYNELGCWCKPESCHGDVLVKLLKEKITLEVRKQSSSNDFKEQKMKSLEKKLRQIDELKKLQQEGHTLERNQLEKIEKETFLLKEFKNNN